MGKLEQRVQFTREKVLVTFRAGLCQEGICQAENSRWTSVGHGTRRCDSPGAAVTPSGRGAMRPER